MGIDQVGIAPARWLRPALVAALLGFASSALAGGGYGSRDPGVVHDEGPRNLALLCIDQGTLVVEREDGTERAKYKLAPGEKLRSIARAGPVLAALTEEDELLVKRGAAWSALGKLSQKGGHGLLRVTSDKAGAHFFIQGGEDEQVAGVADISTSGKLAFRGRPQPAEVARVAPKELGVIDEPGQWDALRQRLKGSVPAGVELEDALEWAEPSPWGGTLVAVAESEGETGLWFVPAEGKPVSFHYQGKAVGYRGLLSYLADGALLLDGRFSAAGKGTLLLRKDGKVSAVPDVDGTCILRPA